MSDKSHFGLFWPVKKSDCISKFAWPNGTWCKYLFWFAIIWQYSPLGQVNLFWECRLWCQHYLLDFWNSHLSVSFVLSNVSEHIVKKNSYVINDIWKIKVSRFYMWPSAVTYFRTLFRKKSSINTLVAKIFQQSYTSVNFKRLWQSDGINLVFLQLESWFSLLEHHFLKVWPTTIHEIDKYIQSLSKYSLFLNSEDFDTTFRK